MYSSQGFQHQAQFDYFKIFTLVVKWETIRIVSDLVGHCGWPIHHVNIQIRFLNGVFDEEVYMVQPNGLAFPSTEHLICQLHLMLYGLKQNPRA